MRRLAALAIALITAAGCNETTPPPPPSGAHGCLNGDVVVEPCGKNNNGFRVLECKEQNYTPKSDRCIDTDSCVDKEILEASCGINGRGTSIAECVNGQYQQLGCVDTDECRDSTTEILVCGIDRKGTQYRQCTEGRWTEPSPCLEQRACTPGMRLPRNEYCGINARGQVYVECADDLLIARCLDNDVCLDNTIRQTSCGEMERGTTTEKCLAGQWSAAGECLPNAPTCGYLLLGRESQPGTNAEQYTLRERFLLINDNGIPAEQRDVSTEISVQYVPPTVPFHITAIRAYIARTGEGAVAVEVHEQNEPVAGFTYQNGFLPLQQGWVELPIEAQVSGSFSVKMSAPPENVQLGFSRGTLLPAPHPRYRSASCQRTSINERVLTDRDALVRVIGYGIMDCTRGSEGNRCMPR